MFGNLKRRLAVLAVVALACTGGAGIVGAAPASAGCTGVGSGTVYAPSGGYNVYYNVQAQNCTSDVAEVQVSNCQGVPSGVAAGWIDSTAGGFAAVCQQQTPRTLTFTTRCDQFTGCIRDNYTNVVRYTAQCWYWQATHYLTPFFQIRWRTILGNGTFSNFNSWRYAYGIGQYLAC